MTSKEITHTQRSPAVLSCFNVTIQICKHTVTSSAGRRFRILFRFANTVYDLVTRPATFVAVVADLSMWLPARMRAEHLTKQNGSAFATSFIIDHVIKLLQ